MTGITSQHADFVVRNPIYETLIRCDWPLAEADGRHFIYYLAFWLPPALICKCFSWSDVFIVNYVLTAWIELGLALALTLLALGCALRLVPAWLLATAALCGVGVALVQGTLPGLIKLHTPRHVAPMMGVYSASLMGGGALGAQLSPLALQWGLGWSGALALWTLPVLAALALAWWQLGRMATPAAGATQRGASAWLLRRPRTWYLMLAFGLMNGGYASMIAWLAPHYQELGWSAARTAESTEAFRRVAEGFL